MDIEEVERLVYIDYSTKGIHVGRSFVVDGYGHRSVRVVTHAHADHVAGLSESVTYSQHLVASPPTHELILAIGYVSNSLVPIYKRKMVSLNPLEAAEFGGERLEFYPADHIIGSVQVRVLVNGYSIGYTGDFKLGGSTRVMGDLDVLVIEATYGDPRQRRPFKEDVPKISVDVVLEGLRKYRRVAVYGYHGKLQEFMKILRDGGVDVPFIMNSRAYSVTRVVEKYGWTIGNYYAASGRSELGFERFVTFDHMLNAKYRRLDGSVLNVVLSGWEFREPIRRIDEHTWLIALSDHADFDELVKYVEISQPRLVVVDGSRSGYPHALARELERRGWRAVVMPRVGA